MALTDNEIYTEQRRFQLDCPVEQDALGYWRFTGKYLSSADERARVVFPTNTPADLTALHAARDAIDTSGGQGGVVLMAGGVFNLGSGATGLVGKENVRFVGLAGGPGARATLLSYTGSGPATDFSSMSRSGIENVRIGVGSSATAIALRVNASGSTSVLESAFRNLELEGGGVAGQIGIQSVATGGQIVSECMFDNITIDEFARPIVKTDVEGNFWEYITIQRFGAGTASPIAIDSQSHAETMSVRVAGISILSPPTGTPVAFKETGATSFVRLVADFGGSGQALNVTGTTNTIIVTRPESAVAIGTYNARNTIIDQDAFAIDSAWNSNHMKLGSYHLWVDSTGDLRIKSSAPSSDTDGTVVGTQS